MEDIKRERLINNMESMVRGYEGCINRNAKVSQICAIISEVDNYLNLDHKAVVEIKDKRYETQLELYKNLTYENDDLRCERNNLTEKVETMQNKIEELQEHLSYIVSQLDYCPLCGEYREEQGAIIHKEDCEAKAELTKGIK